MLVQIWVFCTLIFYVSVVTVQLYFYIPTIGLLDLVLCRANSDCNIQDALVWICTLSCAVFSLNCVKNGAEKKCRNSGTAGSREFRFHMIWIESEIFNFCFLLDCTRWIVSATIPFKVRRNFAKKSSSEKRPQFLNGVEYRHEISYEWTWKELLHFMFSSWVHWISSFNAICRGNLAKIHIFNNYI